MTTERTSNKESVRREAQAARRVLTYKDTRSRSIIDRLLTVPEFARARTIAFYVGVRNEVLTANCLSNWFALGKRIALPWCDENELQLAWVHGPDELALGRFGIPEPKPDLRMLPERQCDPRLVDLFVVPGVAFDERGRRLGHGQGFYDRLLQRSRPDSVRVALAFDCQIVPEVPAEAHDIAMHVIVTESRVIRP